MSFVYFLPAYIPNFEAFRDKYNLFGHWIAQIAKILTKITVQIVQDKVFRFL